MPEPALPTRRDRKRAEIVAVAKTIFFQEGYAGASMAMIAARVGGSKATLYSHFRSKEELLLAVVQEVTDPATLAALDAEAPSDFADWLRWLARVAIEALTTYESLSLQRLAASEALRCPEVGRIFYEEGIRPGHLRLAPRFEQAMEEGLIRRADPVEMVEVFLGVCGAWPLRLVLWNIRPPLSQDEIEALARQSAEGFLEGYRAR